MILLALFIGFDYVIVLIVVYEYEFAVLLRLMDFIGT